MKKIFFGLIFISCMAVAMDDGIPTVVKAKKELAIPTPALPIMPAAAAVVDHLSSSPKKNNRNDLRPLSIYHTAHYGV